MTNDVLRHTSWTVADAMKTMIKMLLGWRTH